MNISEIDKNLKVESDVKRDGLVFFDIKNAPVSIHGVFYENGWTRVPRAVAESVNGGVLHHSRSTAGGRVRFITDSPYVVIKTVQERSLGLGHMAPSGQAGFDLYVNEGEGDRYEHTFVPPYNISGGYDGVSDFADSRERVCTINFPLYHDVRELYIGVKAGSVLKKAPDYEIK
ncbi:MAG: hypothetical protein J6Q68_05650, partial [Clostridia bacterium]|nr:hypothetical protein [Clostridia bacterium]